MLSLFRALLTGLGVILIGTGLGAAVTYAQMEGRVADLASSILTDAFGNDVEVGGVTLSAAERGIVLHDFRLANPEGFENGDALRCERVVIQMAPRSWLADTPVIRNLQLEGTDIQYRYEAGRGTNIGSIAKGLQQSRDDRDDDPRFVVERLRCPDARLHMSTNVVPGTEVGMRVVSVDLENIRDDDPVPPRQITSILLRSVLVETLTLKGLLSPVIEHVKEELGMAGDA